MHYFDYTRVASEARIPAQRLQQLRDIIDREFPRDEMMSELHVLRACMAIKDGLVSLDEVLQAGAQSAATP
jgi:hypothetical protein